MRKLLAVICLLFLSAAVFAAVKIKNDDIADNTIEAVKLHFTPIISSATLQGPDVQFYVSSGTVGTGGLTVLGPLYLPGGVVVSSSVHIAAFSNTLGAGATFYAFTPVTDITLRKLAVTIHTEGTTGSSIWSCGNGANTLDLTTADTDASGSTLEQSGAVDIAAGNKVSCLISQSTQFATPTGVWELEYNLR